MSRLGRSVKRAPVIESSDSEDEEIKSPEKKMKLTPKAEKSSKPNGNESSSSDSDIENYLQPIDKLDFSSEFFNLQKKNQTEFDKIEKNIFDGVARLSDSESDQENGEIPESESKQKESAADTKLNFQQLQDFTKKIEEAKLQVEKYTARNKIRENNHDISNLLAAGESKHQLTLENIKAEDLHSSDFDTTDDEWEEVKAKDAVEEKSIIPKKNIEIRVGDMPEHVKKKKGIDLLAAMKRRLNRIRKENQIYIHQVHLLCWIAHGNFLNSVINDTEVLATALSLLPSEKSYPSDRPDLGYFEQIVQWYKKSIRLTEKPPAQQLTLKNSLKLQMKKKEAFDKNAVVLIFVAIMRALGIQCRLVLSFQVEPLRPPASELHSLSAKVADSNKNIPSTSKSSSPGTSKSEKSEVSNPKAKKSTTSKISEKKKEPIKPVTGNTSTKEDIKQNKGTSKGSSIKTNDIKEKVIKKTLKEKTEASSSNKSKNKDENVKDSKTNERRTSTRKKEESEKQSKLSGSENDKQKDVTNKKGQSSANEEKSTKEFNTKKASTKSIAQDKGKTAPDKGKTATIVAKESKKTKSEATSNNEDKAKKFTSNALKVEESKSRSESESSVKKSENSKTRSKSTTEVIKIKLPDQSRTRRSSSRKIPQLDGGNDEEKPKKASKKDKPNLTKLKQSPKTARSLKKHKSRLTSSFNDDDSESEFSESPSKSPEKRINFAKLNSKSTSSFTNPFDVKNDIISLIKGRIAEQKSMDRRKLADKKKNQNFDSDSDSDYMSEAVKKKHHDSDSDIEYFVPKQKVKKRIRVKKEGGKLKVLSSDDEGGKKKKKGFNMWVEVFLEAEEKWICADLVRGQVHCVNELFMRASHPVSYIVAWNNDSTLKDVTMRYCKNFNTVTRKLRINAKWWEKSLKPFLEKSTPRSKEEDNDLVRQQLDQPLPTTISEYKNHPLYAIRRHLLKFQAIYPDDIVPLGYIRGEAVYPRNSVYTCHSRDIWLKEAKVVKPGEEPYKVVKARPTYDRLSNTFITGKLLDVFGEWQTTDYEPPTAENGVVPRNAYGNVDLFKTCMLPKGTVLLKLPGLNKVCRKLNIDCATAMVGFDFHGGWSHPVYDGFVVCKEYEDTCIAAWHQEQEEIERKENEKIDKRVYTNWKKLIKGLLIRERLKARYDFGGETSGTGKGKGKGQKKADAKKRKTATSESESESE